MLGADIIAKILQSEKVSFISGFPENLVFNSASALDIRPLISRTERIAVNIADGFTRMTNGRRIGVVAVQDGPGAEAAYAAVAQAYGDGTPILVIPGSYDRSLQNIAPYLRVDQCFKDISKSSIVVNNREELIPAFRRAYTALRHGKGGPCIVSPARDLLYEEFPDSDVNYTSPRGHRWMADPADVAEIGKMLISAKQPVIIAGQGVLYAEASEALCDLAELMQIPVMTTLNGKSAFPENHDLSLGTGGLSRPKMIDYFLAKADVVLGVGTSLTVSDFITPIPQHKIIGQITNAPEDICKCYDVKFGAIGDAKMVLHQLLEDLRNRLGEGGRREETQTIRELKTIKKEYMAEWMPRLTSDDTPISPYRVIFELMQSIDRTRSVVTHDSGNPRDQTIPFFEAIVPRGYLGWGKTTPLGSSMGLTMGAKLAKPDWLAINIMGDAAFGMIGMDFETAVRLNIPILTIVLKNGVLGGYDKFMPEAVKRYSANRVSGNYADLARDLGGYSETVNLPDQLQPALKRCIQENIAGHAALLEVATKEESIFPRGQ